MAPLDPASSTTGFFQRHPVLRNPLDDDAALQRCLELFAAPLTIDAIHKPLRDWASVVVSPQVFTWIADAERNPPFIRGSGFTAFGHPEADALVTSEGWRALQALGIREGIVARGYEPGIPHPPDTRLVQMLRLQLWCASSAYVACPSAMQDGAVAVLRRELGRLSAIPISSFVTNDFLVTQSRAVFTRALQRLTSRDPAMAWTSGQWMTERAGGSDVAGTETIARWAGPSDAHHDGTDIDDLPLGPWLIDGFKWFSSATDCGAALLLAKTARGLGCFFAPTRKRVDSAECMNGLHIQRLKNKLGTRALPTAELELKGMRAWLVGNEGEGVKVISAMLNITRVYNAATAMGHLGRGLAIVRSYAAVRTFPSQPSTTLQTLPLFASTTASTTLQYRAGMLLTALVAALLGATEHAGATAAGPSSEAARVGLVPADDAAIAALLRLLTPLAKARTAKAAIAGLQECMEALGGVGYCENAENQEMNVARLYRDANVLSIWEGTTDVMATDAVKVLCGRDGPRVLAVLDSWVSGIVGEGGLEVVTKSTILNPSRARLRSIWHALHEDLIRTGRAELLARGREVLDRCTDVVCGVLFVADAARDNDTVALECCLRFVEGRFGLPDDRTWVERSRWDGAIAFGTEAAVRGKL